MLETTGSEPVNGGCTKYEDTIENIERQAQNRTSAWRALLPVAVIRKGANNSGKDRKFTVGVRKFAILLLLSVQILQLLLGFRVWSTAPLDWNLAYNGVYLTV